MKLHPTAPYDCNEAYVVVLAGLYKELAELWHNVNVNPNASYRNVLAAKIQHIEDAIHDWQVAGEE
jgi:hypothetical protein